MTESLWPAGKSFEAERELLEPQERNERVYKGQFDTDYVLMKNQGLFYRCFKGIMGKLQNRERLKLCSADNL
jgi:hypothetical protein